jgi:putative ABC transport system permease protein
MNNTILNIIWKRKKRSQLLLFEFMVSFIIIFVICTILTIYLINFNKPLGFNYINVWEVLLESKGDKDNINNELEEESIIKRIESTMGTEYVTQQIFNLEFRASFTTTHKFSYKNEKNVRPYIFGTSDDFNKVFNIRLLEGRWYDTQDNSSKYMPIVINKKLRNEIFGKRKAVGEVVKAMNDQECIVVGVVDDFRYLGDFSGPRISVFTRSTKNESIKYPQNIGNTSTSFGMYYSAYYIKVLPGSGIAFEEALYNDLSEQFPNWVITITTLEKLRSSYFLRVWVPLIIILLVAGFLIFNVVLGLFGVLWYNISLRKSEIGLRMAVGATKGNIYKQFISEMLVLSTLGIIPGLIITAQFPILKVFDIETKVYIIAILAAVLLIYLLVMLCALLPSAQAARIQPAEALYEE